MADVVLALDDVTRVHSRGSEVVHAIHGVSLSISRASFVAIVGPSGAGKSSLLHVMGALDRPTSGRVTLEGEDLTAMRPQVLTLVRRRRLGFVFQFFNLLPNLLVWQNIGLPLLMDGVPPAEVLRRVEPLAERLGIAGRLRAGANSLSGGEMQRTALARALITAPALVLADEPTGNLDRRASREVVEMLRESVREHGQTVVMVTHDDSIARETDRVVRIVDGQVASDSLATGGGIRA